MKSVANITKIIRSFNVKGDVTNFASIDSGHINDSYLVETLFNGLHHKFFLQKINHHVFKDTKALMENIALVTKLMKDFYSEMHCNETLQLYSNINGSYEYIDEKENHWRLFTFITDAYSTDHPSSPEMAFEGGRAFGFFQKLLNTINPKVIHTIIPRFHDMNYRFEQFDAAVQADPKKRLKEVQEEVNFVNQRRKWGDIMQGLIDRKEILMRVTHNDTKISNVIFDKNSKKAKTVIDLDTIMPGTLLWDFGDMVRTFCTEAVEDEKDLSKVFIDFNLMVSLCKGYLWEIRKDLTEGEKREMYFGGKYICMIMGLRFLTDYIQGDTYYRTSYNNQNLLRCRTQFKLTLELEENEDLVKQIIRKSIDLF